MLGDTGPRRRVDCRGDGGQRDGPPATDGGEQERADMSYETLKIEREGPLMIMRLNRPERRNAINRQNRKSVV